MRIKVTLVGPLKKYLNGTSTSVIDLSVGAEVGHILNEIPIPSKWVSMMTVNGIKVSIDYGLKENDEVVIFPLVSGG